MLGKLQVRGPAFGPCGICGVPSKLTDDHIPPKGAVRISQMEMLHLVAALTADPPTKKNRISQNGVKFRTICAECNNVRLGRDTDPDLVSLTQQVAAILRSPLTLPRSLGLRIRPQRVLRAVVGHVLAYGVNRVPAGPFEDALAAYFLDTSMAIPKSFDCFYWLYPYNDQLVVRDAIRMDTRLPEDENILFKLLKFYPVAFLLTWKKPSVFNPPVPNLCDHRSTQFDSEVEAAFNLLPLPPRRWPETPDVPSACVLYGGDAMYAKAYVAGGG